LRSWRRSQIAGARPAGLQKSNIRKEKTATKGGLSLLCVWLVIYANDTLRRDCRQANPNPRKPTSIIAHVEASGAAAADCDPGRWPQAEMVVA
jgi:hypothetical protein